MRHSLQHAKSFPGHTRLPRRLRRISAAVAIISLVTSLLIADPANATADGDRADGDVVFDWNLIAQQTLFGDTTRKPTEWVLYMAFVQAAVYNAVVGIEGRYAPYRFDTPAPKGASSQAAAAAAAHGILVKYEPSAKGALDHDLAASLENLPDKGKADGIAYGELAAQTLINARVNDGRNASVTFTRPPAPGVWRPTSLDDTAQFMTPWLGAVTPLMLRNGAQFGEPGPPPSLTSVRYTRDFNEVKTFGAQVSTARKPWQTDTALFFSGNAFVQVNTALRDQITTRKLDIVDAARTLAAADMSIADTLISVWHAKYLYGFWRPISAITLADTDGNPRTISDPTWQPLLTTPPYPDYVSGYTGIICSLTAALGETLHTPHLRLNLISTAVPNVTRSYDFGPALCGAVVNARVWLGIHFRTADTTAALMATRVVGYALDRNFRPERRPTHS